MYVFIIWFLFGIVTAFVANNNGGNFLLWFLLGILFGIFALVCAFGIFALIRAFFTLGENSNINDAETPQNIKIKHTNEQLIIINKWFSWKTDEALKDAIVGLYIILLPFMYIIHILKEALNLFLENFWINLFRVPLCIFLVICFLMVANDLIYRALAMLFNKTYIIIDNKAITISHKPLSYPSAGINKTFRIDKLKYLYCLESYKNRTWVETFEERYRRDINKEELAHDIRAVPLTGKDKKLVELKDYYQADYIKRLLQNFFDIKTEPFSDNN